MGSARCGARSPAGSPSASPRRSAREIRPAMGRVDRACRVPRRARHPTDRACSGSCRHELSDGAPTPDVTESDSYVVRRSTLASRIFGVTALMAIVVLALLPSCAATLDAAQDGRAAHADRAGADVEPAGRVRRRRLGRPAGVRRSRRLRDDRARQRPRDQPLPLGASSPRVVGADHLDPDGPGRVPAARQLLRDRHLGARRGRQSGDDQQHERRRRAAERRSR